MKSQDFLRAEKHMKSAEYSSVILAIIMSYHRLLPFDESVELIDLAQEQLNKIYGMVPVNQRGV
jgi:oligoendopeptidase F